MYMNRDNMKDLKKQRSVDPIFDNKYNRGEIEYDVLPQIEINKIVVDSRIDIYYDSYSHFRIELLNELIENIWNNTFWGQNYTNIKKISKHDLAEIYTHLKHNLNDDTFSNVDLFVGIADFLDVDYKLLFDMIPPTYKKEITKEIDAKYNVIKKQRIYKLF